MRGIIARGLGSQFRIDRDGEPPVGVLGERRFRAGPATLNRKAGGKLVFGLLAGSGNWGVVVDSSTGKWVAALIDAKEPFGISPFEDLPFRHLFASILPYCVRARNTNNSLIYSIRIAERSADSNSADQPHSGTRTLDKPQIYFCRTKLRSRSSRRSDFRSTHPRRDSGHVYHCAEKLAETSSVDQNAPLRGSSSFGLSTPGRPQLISDPEFHSLRKLTERGLQRVGDLPQPAYRRVDNSSLHPANIGSVEAALVAEALL